MAHTIGGLSSREIDLCASHRLRIDRTVDSESEISCFTDIRLISADPAKHPLKLRLASLDDTLPAVPYRLVSFINLAVVMLITATV